MKLGFIVKRPLRIHGYSIFRNDRDDGYGGVAIVVHNSIKAHIYLHNNGIQIMCIQIINCKLLKFVASFYCPGSIVTTQYDWDNVWSMFSEKSIMAGDFNAHHSNWSNRNNSRGVQIVDSSIDSNFMCLNSGEMARIKLVDIAIYFKSWLVTKENISSDLFISIYKIPFRLQRLTLFC